MNLFSAHDQLASYTDRVYARPRSVTPDFSGAGPMEPFDDIWLFVPMDPSSDELEAAFGFAEVFAGAITGAILGGLGLEHLAHLIHAAEHVGEFQDALQPRVSPAAVQEAVRAWRASGRSFAAGEVKGVWVRSWVTRRRMLAALGMCWPYHRFTLPAARMPVSGPARGTTSQATVARPHRQLRYRWH